MSETSIGKLNVKIAADSTGFHNVLARAEKDLSGFAAKAMSPLTMGMGAGAGMMAMGMNPIMAVMGPLTHLVESIPGLEEYSIFFDPSKHAAAMKGVQEQTMDLARAAERLNFEPQFLKALRLTAGPLADQLEPALLKLSRFQGELRKGGEDVLSAGGRKATTIAEKWGFDPQEIANMTQQEFLLKFADQLKAIESPAERVAMAMDIVGKSGARTANVFAQGSEAIEKWLHLVKELGVGTPEQIAMAKTVQLMEKLHKLHVEALHDREFMAHGGPQMAAKLEMENAHTLTEWLTGLARFRAAAPGGDPWKSIVGDVGKSPLLEKMLKDIKALTEAPPIELPEETDADKAVTALERMNQSLDDQEELLRLTNDGWGDLAKHMLELGKLMEMGLPDDQWMAMLQRLGEMRDVKDLEQQAKDLEQFQTQVMGKVGKVKTEGLYAPVALAGGNEAAAAFNRQWTSGGGGDLILTVEQILKLMQKPAVPEEMQQNVRDAFKEMQKLNGKLNPVGPVNE